jgi:hypothetical protein
MRTARTHLIMRMRPQVCIALLTLARLIIRGAADLYWKGLAPKCLVAKTMGLSAALCRLSIKLICRNLGR